MEKNKEYKPVFMLFSRNIIFDYILIFYQLENYLAQLLRFKSSIRLEGEIGHPIK